MWLFLLFLSIPLIEIALFIQIGDVIGLWNTLIIVILTAIIGSYLVRTQGFMAMRNLQGSFQNLSDPTEPLAHGAMILISGILLLTPGFFTDFLGFSLCLPFVRTALFHAIRKKLRVQSTYSGDPVNDEDIIDATFEDLDAPRSSSHESSKWGRH